MIDAPETFDEIICYKCDGKKHISRFCPYADAIKAYGIALRETDEHRNKKRRTKKLKSKKPPKPETNDKTLMRLKTKPKKRNGYTAYEDTSDSGLSESTSDSSEDFESELDSGPSQKVILTKKLIRKSTPAEWVLDNGATSPMTDQIHLFRGRLKRINTITIQVGGGTLKLSHRETVEVKFADGSSGIAKKVFYVTNLGVNLLSAKPLCKTGMKSFFDEKNVRIKDGEKIVIRAVQNDGLYIVKHIANELRGKPLDARIRNQSACSATEKLAESNPQASHLENRIHYDHDDLR
ncbi:hypothetical protein K3495_g1409 [Podosphaera aphanis]|nr:hypothetical protein K3495_g1409 [Podosphaera aphanis]